MRVKLYTMHSTGNANPARTARHAAAREKALAEFEAQGIKATLPPAEWHEWVLTRTLQLVEG